jgi:WD40 repeat protein
MIVVSGSDDRTVRVWDAATASQLGEPRTGHTGPVTTVAAAGTDRIVVVSGATDHTVRSWEIVTDRPGTAAGASTASPLCVDLAAVPFGLAFEPPNLVVATESGVISLRLPRPPRRARPAGSTDQYDQ